MPKTVGAKYLDGQYTVTILAVTVRGYVCDHSLWGEQTLEEGDIDELQPVEYTKDELEAAGQMVIE